MNKICMVGLTLCALQAGCNSEKKTVEGSEEAKKEVRTSPVRPDSEQSKKEPESGQAASSSKKAAAADPEPAQDAGAVEEHEPYEEQPSDSDPWGNEEEETSEYLD